MKGKALLISVCCLLFVLIGSVAAADFNDSYTDNLNLVQDANEINVASVENLEVSSNNSISETNSRDDNLNNYPNGDVESSNYMDNQNLEINSVADIENTYLVVDNITLYVFNGTKLIATLFDSNNNPIAGQLIYLSINGRIYNRTTDANGNVFMNINLLPGVYDIQTIYKGNSQYNKSSVNSTVTVLTTILGDDLTKYYKNGSQFIVQILDNNGMPAKGKNVKFNINGKFYSRTTDDEGNAKLVISLLPGTYIITTVLENGFMSSNVVTVLSILKGEDIVKYFRNGTQYHVTLLNNVGEPYANANVTMNINGVFYQRTTNENGTAILVINLLPGDYIITAIAPNGFMSSNFITVLPTILADDLTKYYLDSQTFDATILNGKGQVIPNVNVTFNINGRISNIETNDNGVARLPITLAPNYYTVTVYYNNLFISKNIQVLAANPIISASNVQGFSHLTVQFPVLLTYPNGEPIRKQNIVATVNGNSYTVATNENGTAVFKFNDLSIGEHVVNYNFAGYGGLSQCNGSNVIKIVNSTSLFEAKDLYMEYGDGSKFTVTLMDLNQTPLDNKPVNLTVNGVTYNRITDENGSASLSINLHPGKYVITYSYSTPDKEDYAFGSNNIYISKHKIILEGSDVEINYGETAKLIVKATDSKSSVILNANVIITVNGKSYTVELNKSGIATLDIKEIPVGVYNVTYVLDSVLYNASDVGSVLVVNGYKLTGEDMTISKNVESPFDILVTDAYGKPISNEVVEFTVLDNVYNSTTNKDGIARITLPPLNDSVVVYYCCANNKQYKGQNNVFVYGTVSLSTIIEGALALKNYIESNLMVPDNVNIAGTTYTTAQFLYLLSEATVCMSNGVFDGEVQLLAVENPLNPSSDTVVGNLYDYKSLAQNLINFMETNGMAPNSINTAIGDCGFYPVVYALARTVAFYKTNGVMPAYVSLKSVSNVIPSSPLDTPNTIADLAPYLLATRNCQVNNEKIQELAKTLTAGKTSDWDKAQAIYNYVRDKISYSFYYNSKYGAYNTLFSSGTANCCDQANAVIALFRAAGLPARYVHGTCRFSSGSTYGHVWAQVLIGDTWVVADPTSTRNSLGVVNNWNNYAYTLHGYYRELSF